MQERLEVTRADFIREVKAFEAKHNHPLKELLDMEKRPETVKEFLSHPVIRAYLCRPTIAFIDNHPALVDSLAEQDHENSDHYELEVYRHLPHVLLYRSETITTPSFYSVGTHSYDLEPLMEKKLGKGSADYTIITGYDIYETADLIMSPYFVDIKSIGDTFRAKKFAKVKQTERFLVLYHKKDAHACTMLCIKDPKTQRPLVTILINSWASTDRNNYHDYLKERFLMNRNYLNGSAVLNLTVEKELNQLFGIKLKNANHLFREEKVIELPIDAQDPTPAACIIKASSGVKCSVNPYDLRKKGYKKIYIKKNDIDGSATVELMYQPTELFIDASHHLQTEKGDENCSLYSYHFIQGIVKMLKKPQIADRIYQLALETRVGNQEAQQLLVKQFQDELKVFLPCYYDPITKQAKPQDEIKMFHLEKRWLLGGQTLKMKYPTEMDEEEDDILLLSDVAQIQSVREEFDALLKKLKITTNRLAETYKENKSYESVNLAATKLVANLEASRNAFFGDQTNFSISKFKKCCQKEIDEAYLEFSQHRGIWFGEFHPIIRKILGILAILTVLPALATVATNQGFLNTFFSQPKTKASMALDEFKSDLTTISIM